MSKQTVAIMTSEDCAERAFYYAMLSNEAKAKARYGSAERRAAYRKQAQAMEEMVGVWMAIANAKRVPPSFVDVAFVDDNDGRGPCKLQNSVRCF